jgi:hypothetical protein
MEDDEITVARRRRAGRAVRLRGRTVCPKARTASSQIGLGVAVSGAELEYNLTAMPTGSTTVPPLSAVATKRSSRLLPITDIMFTHGRCSPEVTEQKNGPVPRLPGTGPREEAS